MGSQWALGVWLEFFGVGLKSFQITVPSALGVSASEGGSWQLLRSSEL